MASYELALEALRSLKPDEKPNISLVARTYGVNQSNLSKRFRGVTGSKEAQYNNQRLLSKEQSRTLIKWINQLTERGLPPTNSMLENFAREISGKEPGKNWASRWLKAHSDKVISRYSKGLDSDRKKADSAYKYTLYFELIGRKIEQYNLTPDQIYNMDEKGFMLGVSTKERRIFTRRKYEQGGYKQHLQDGNREWITTIGCICANGTAISPALIYMAKSGNLQDSWLQDFDAEQHRCFFATSESGWTNNEVGFAWLVNVFDKETKSQASRGWRLLILDGHGSHVTMRFIEYCDKNRILLAIFPAHSTHTLQPPDVAIFSPLSTAYTEQLRRFINDCQGFTRLTKRDFFRLFWASWEATFTSENILSAFKHTGLCPFNPDLVIQKFTKKIESRPSSSDSGASIIPAEDWRRLRKLVQGVFEDLYDQKAIQLKDTVLHLSTENILLKNEIAGLQRALIHSKKRSTKGRALLFDIPTENEGGALFMSPSKVQQARDNILKKDEQAAQEQARKDDKKLQQELTKQAKEQEKAERAQIRQEKQEQRLQEATEKQRLKDEQELAKLAHLQLQNDVLATPSAPKRAKKQVSKQVKVKAQPEAHTEDNGVVVTTNRRGRAIRPPARFRD
ncbi:pogo transposable element, putative [Talaromyces marneffei ATCC 18224]|uniref:Pogo transposable element, putative n=2 Tax=Talaromyces marneffei (strain ATCC 18224 / CBS 334.59 / QM 7333) TaxID=441960 RepID=B6QM63_TALMQ|nr:pogo transposable element, putative [Talaromyces marneffei ATCC 18224]